MLSRLLNKALVKLDIKDSQEQAAAKAAVLLYPTIAFPPPPQGTRSICTRCLTLLSHFVYLFGDGNDYQPLVITHSSAIRDLSHAVQMNYAVTRKDTTECVICTKVFILFKAMQAHVSFEDSWRDSPSTHWSLTWEMALPSYETDQDRLHVKFSVTHKGGYGWGIGGFMVHPDRNVVPPRPGQAHDPDVDIPLYGGLDGEKAPDFGKGPLEFSSTLSTGTLSSVTGWAKTCAESHTKCRKILNNEGGGQPNPWFPERLIQVRRKVSGALTARLVLKSNPAHFPTPISGQLPYLSFSHCWGPTPDPSAPLGGREGSVLTKDTLPKWTDTLPVNDLPMAFRHAITICAWLDLEYIWIDSLCIMQDSKEDWETQSAVMGDIYRFAFINIAALASTSDYNGFIFTRDTRIVFGFRCSLARIIARNEVEWNPQRKQCILLKGQARLLWDFQKDIQGSTDSNTPLFTRAWVYQERSLAPRTLAFANSAVYWTCDEHSLCERPGWGGLSPEGLRRTLHQISDTMYAMKQGGVIAEQAQSLVEAVDYCWTFTVTKYTQCKITKHSDKLIAISSVARQLASTQIMQTGNIRYLAGFWDINLLSQLAWITVVGSTTTPRKWPGEEEYSAPSWSWASVEAPVQPQFFLSNSSTKIALANVLGADVELATDYKFGSIKAGWVRLRGILYPVRSGKRSAESISLTDDATGENFWFCSDTVEGFHIVRTGRARSLVWMPMFVTIDQSISGKCLVLMEAEGQHYGGSNGFVRAGERVYRRMGTGNFGRSIDMLQSTDLVLRLGTYPDIQPTSAGADVAKGFKRKEVGMQEFVLI